jgi:hypothetical protein
MRNLLPLRADSAAGTNPSDQLRQSAPNSRESPLQLAGEA